MKDIRGYKYCPECRGVTKPIIGGETQPCEDCPVQESQEGQDLYDAFGATE